MAAPVETKVQASTAAAAVSGLALWSLGHWVFEGDVPDVVASWVYVLVPGVLAFAAGYLARHTDRPSAPPAIATSGGYAPAGGMPEPSVPPPGPAGASGVIPPAAPE